MIAGWAIDDLPAQLKQAKNACTGSLTEKTVTLFGVPFSNAGALTNCIDQKSLLLRSFAKSFGAFELESGRRLLSGLAKQTGQNSHGRIIAAMVE
jgi:hypothetical protein